MSTLKDKTILVTGAGNGIGRAVSKGFAAAGATVVLLDKDVPSMERLYDEILDDGSPEPAIYPMDLTGASPDDYFGMAETIGNNFQTLEGLLHNASFLPYLSRIDDYESDIWFQVMQVNLNAGFLLTHACLPLLRAAGKASLVLTTDAVAEKPKAYWGAYAAAKGGLESLMSVLADELENSDIRVNAVDPGATSTRFRKSIYPGEDASTVKQPDALVPLYNELMNPESGIRHGKVVRFAGEWDYAL
ncbi:MAG: SDR family NAD(P)-dependent oxidoreductase [Chromatiales bacterium]|jgi:NAD(P)-dependent dehydrogenase (short-subunit alcohol dehydrogenase family)